MRPCSAMVNLKTDATEADPVGTALAYLLLGIAAGLCLDLCAKELLRSIPLNQFVFLRSAIGLGLFVLLARRFGGIRALITRRWRWHVLRTILATGAMFGFFYGLARMPLVNALTLGFTAPLMMTALSVPFLGERVGWRRWCAVLVGFAGVLVVLRPGTGFLSVAALTVLVAAFCYACLALNARYLGKTESSFALSVYVVAGPLIVSGVLSLGGPWVVPDARDWILLLAAGACSVIAWVGLIGGYRRASPAILAPFEYTALIGGAVAGYFFWGEVPDRFVLAGALVIITSGLYVVYREMQWPAAVTSDDRTQR
ncbi:MAG TPA: DMT family transporter [Woeseiaceae bacterium]|nr:DMT family transporter [Woeseiaceae bacterium]